MHTNSLPQQPRHDHIPGQFIIKFRPGALHELSNVSSSDGDKALMAAMPESITGPMNFLRSELGAVSMKPLFARGSAGRHQGMGLAAAHGALKMSLEATPRESLSGFQLIRTAKQATSIDDLRKRLAGSRAIDFIEPVPNRWPAFGSADPMQNRQWALRAIKWFETPRPQAREVHVAILDSGVDMNHPDLQGSIEAYNHAGNAARDYCGHGTHVAGTIAAMINNGIGIAGVTNCRLHCWKIFNDAAPDPTREVGDFNYEYFSQALGSLLDAENKIRVVNLSLGGPSRSQTEAVLFGELRSAGILVVAAMGNEYQRGNPTSYPAAYDGVLAVGASDITDKRGAFSNTGQHIKLAAPGVSVLSTVPTGGSVFSKKYDYDLWDGTSMATPHVAGCAALVFAARNGNADARSVEKALIDGARKVPAMSGKNFTQEFGFGVVCLNGVLSNKAPTTKRRGTTSKGKGPARSRKG